MHEADQVMVAMEDLRRGYGELITLARAERPAPAALLQKLNRNAYRLGLTTPARLADALDGGKS